MNKKYYIIILTILITLSYSRSMEFTSCKTYVKVEKNLNKGEEFCLLALDVEPDNSYIPFFMGQYIYRKQKKPLEAGRMFLKAKERPDKKIENPYRVGKDQWIRTVHQAIEREAYNWFNYGVDANTSRKYEDAIEHFKIASELDAKLTGKCYSAISEIYFNNQEIDKALEFINQALDKTTDADIVLDLQINKAQYLRKNGQVEEALTIFESLSEESINVVAKNELFLIHMDNDDCKKSIEIGEPLFITMEEDPNVSMAKLSELAFNIAACFNQQADKSYNEIIEYLGAEEKNNELTELNLERSETVKDLYSSAKDYYRLSLDYDEDSSTTTKEYKKKMRKDIRKVDEQIIPALEGLLE